MTCNKFLGGTSIPNASATFGGGGGVAFGRQETVTENVSVTHLVNSANEAITLTETLSLVTTVT